MARNQKGQAHKWSQDEVKLAQALGTHLYMAVKQRRVEDIFIKPLMIV